MAHSSFFDVEFCLPQVEFSRGLVILAIEKLLHDVPELLVMETTFAHVVDETLAFHRDLISVYGYPESQPSCLDVLMEPEPFRTWLAIEKKCECPSRYVFKSPFYV